jgi:hypothetical protein
MLTIDEVLEHATKEHTAEFKSAVEKCKQANTDSNVNCFAVVTSAFKKAKRPVYLSDADFGLNPDIQFDWVALAKGMPDSSFAYIKDGERHLPYKDHEGNVDPDLVRNALAELQQINLSADAKIAVLKKLLDAAKAADMNTTTELASLVKYNSYRDSTFTASNDMASQLTDKLVIELSGVSYKWESLGHALRVTGELMKPGTYTGVDGKTCRWTDAVLSRHYKTLFGMPVRMFHKAEGIYKKLPVPAGEVVGHITHLAEYFGRIFYKALVFPRKAQDYIRYGVPDNKGIKRQMRESLEARVALSKPDASGVPNIVAWQGIGFAFTDTPAVKGRDDPDVDPVALARNNTMGNDPDGGSGSGDPQTPPASPEPTPQSITLSASDLQNIVKAAVGEATEELKTELSSLKESNETLSKDLKELADVRNEARLAEIKAMEEDITKHDPNFKPEMLYDPEKTSLAQKEHDLSIYIRGINLGAKIQTDRKPAVILADDPEAEKAWLDAESIKMFGKPYEQMLAAGPVDMTGGAE